MRRKIDGHRLHLTKDGDVWLNTEVQDYDGLVIGCAGTTPASAIDAAVATLLKVVQALKAMRVDVMTKDPTGVGR